MFKRAGSATSKEQNPLSGKDVRGLVEEILASFASASDETSSLDKKVLKKTLGLHSKASVTKKRVGPNKTVVWELGGSGAGSDSEEEAKPANQQDEETDAPGVPIFFEASTSMGTRVCPTVYTLWKLPNLLKSVETWGPVSEKVVSGADLMLPGFIVDTSKKDFDVPLERGDLVSIKVQGNPYPIAVGEMATGSRDALASGMKGKGVCLIHSYGDDLWRYGGATVPHFASFKGTHVDPIQEEEEAAASPAAAEALELPSKKKKKTATPSTSEVPDISSLSVSSTGEPSTALEPWMSDPSELVERAFMQALHALPDEALPILTTVFYSEHLLPARPSGTAPVDIKTTKFKKLGKLVQTMRKKGVIKTEEDGDTERITKVNRNDSSYRNHVKWSNQASKEGSSNNNNNNNNTMPDTDSEDEASASKSAKKSGKPAAKPVAGRVQVVEVFAPPSSEHIRAVLSLAEPSPSELTRARGAPAGILTESAARAALSAYAEREQLIDARGVIALNKTLTHALFQNTKKKEGESYPTHLTLPEAWGFFAAQLSKYHVITRPGASEPLIRKGDVRPVRVTLEARHGGRKHLTHVLNLEKFGIDPEEFAEKSQRKFSAACTTQPLPGKADAGLVEVLIQGDAEYLVVEWLTSSEWGLGKEHLEVTPKRG